MPAATKKKSTKKVSSAKKKMSTKKKIMQVKKKILRRHTGAMKKKTPSKPKILGRVVHYYGKPGVAIIEVVSAISLGDTIRFRHGTKDYTEPVTSLQIDHQPVTKAKKGDVIGMKVAAKTPSGAMVLPG